MNTRLLLRTMVVSVVLLQPSLGAAQDAMTQARALYASADYEQALKLLADVPPGREAHYYRALCLIALGRQDAAQDQIAAVVAIDPMFVPAAGDVSPRVTATFTETRRRLLPDVARQTFSGAREKFQAGDRDGARKDFELTLRMLDDSQLGEGDDLADLRLVASGFLDLAKVEPTPEPAPEPPPAPAAVVEQAPAPAVATLPVTIRQELPPWRPDSTSAGRVFSGAVRVEIDAAGRVTNASMQRPVYPSYDSRVLAAARGWTYQPATLNGVPVPSEKTVEILLQP